ncbi:MAG: DUF2075 domain-containing protein [Bacteroidales bacterium]|nr:DUF2075 domain-containing protein [Bacteroidales bacterium]
MNRCSYQNSIAGFLDSQESDERILGVISQNTGFDDTVDQKNAWASEVVTMKALLSNYKGEDGEIIFEYSIPRLGKRIDVVLLLRGVVFVLEFKDRYKDEPDFQASDFDQTIDYALDLKYFHLPSEKSVIVPILVVPNAQSDYPNNVFEKSSDTVYSVIGVNKNGLYKAIETIFRKENLISSAKNNFGDWVNGRYVPSPTIIEAAMAWDNNHTVEDITKTEADGSSLQKTTNYILDVIEDCKKDGKKKSICFVTGVPGAGKTLVGLNVAISQSTLDESNERNLAVYLSGNGPLVKVLTEALAQDKIRRKKGRIDDARQEVSQFIQGIHNYRENMLLKIKKQFDDGNVHIDEDISPQLGKSGHAEIEHVAIFDEAQRSWTHERLRDWLKRGGSYGNKPKIADFPMSEAEFLIWALNLRKDWAVIVCLVGGGQEINTGEAGIAEWIKAVNNRFPDWNVYISPQLQAREYAEGNLETLLAKTKNLTYAHNLHLSVSMRSFRAEKLSDFVHSLLELDSAKSRQLLSQLSKYHLVLTRDLDKAKQWLRDNARGNERYGIIVSSKAHRLKPLSIDVRFKPDVVHWFLAGKDDVRSSMYLEDAVMEYDVQGLELDWTCLVWDADFRYSAKGWEHYSFSAANSKWHNIKSYEDSVFQLNAYRVLLTRARQGMVICVPEGNPDDPTRLPEFYNSTYQYLKEIGIRELE